MAFFRRKKDRVLDLTERYKRQLDEATKRQSNLESEPVQVDSQSSSLSFLGGLASGAQSTSVENIAPVISLSEEERKRKLAKRLIDMTKEIENLSNQIYHLQQKVELLEKKIGIARE